MAFPAKLLNEDEEKVLDLRPHWWFITPAASLLVLAMIAGAAAAILALPRAVLFLVAILLVVALANFLWKLVEWMNTNFVVTSDRVIFRQGLVSRSGIEMPIDKINTVSFHQSVFGRLAGSGNLVIESASDQDQVFTDIQKPLAIQQEINRQIDLHDARTAQRHGGLVGESTEGSIPDQIAQLAALRDQGVVSEEEFQFTKRQLLGRM